MNKIGTLKIVASTGGLKLLNFEDWLNPAQKVTPSGIEHLKALKGKKVSIDFNDNGKYVSCNLCSDNVDIKSCPSTENNSLQSPNTQTSIARQSSIVRQSCLKTAGEVMKSLNSTAGYDAGMLSKETIKVAENFETWVNRKC